MKRVFLKNGERLVKCNGGVRGTQQWCIYNKLLEQTG